MVFIIIIANLNADEKFSFQVKPILYLMSGIGSGLRSDDGPFFLFADVEFKYAINQKLNLFINPSFANAYSGYSITIYTYFPDYSKETIHYFRSGLNFITGILYRPYETGLRGMYIGVYPIIGWGYLSRNDKKYKDFLNLGYMTEIGYDWIFKNGFSITLGGGISKIYAIPSDSYNETESPIKIGNNLYGLNLWKLPFDLRIRFSIGYSF